MNTGTMSLAALLVLPAISGGQQLPTSAKQLAKTFGVDPFGKIEAIRYTSVRASMEAYVA